LAAAIIGVASGGKETFRKVTFFIERKYSLSYLVISKNMT